MALGDVGQSGIAADVAYCRGFPCGYFKNYLRNEDQNQVLTFRDIANIQRLEVLIWTTYDLQGGPLKGLGAGIGLFAAGERAGDLANSLELPGYVRTDAALYYRKPEIFTRTNLIAQLNVRNLLDQEYFYSGGQGRASAAFHGAPATVLGSIKLEFY